jgi:hypothetical protein
MRSRKTGKSPKNQARDAALRSLVGEAIRALNEQRQLSDSLLRRYESAISTIEQSAHSNASDGTATPPPRTPLQPILLPAKALLARFRSLLSRSWFWNLVNLAGFAIALVTLAALLYDYRPQLLLSPLTTLDNAKPMSTQFTVRNTGRLPVRDLQFWCYMQDVQLTSYITITGLKRPVHFATQKVTLSPAEEITISCEFERSVNPGKASISSADITFYGTFRLAQLPWSSESATRFRTKTRADSTLAWVPDTPNVNPDTIIRAPMISGANE